MIIKLIYSSFKLIQLMAHGGLMKTQGMMAYLLSIVFAAKVCKIYYIIHRLKRKIDKEQYLALSRINHTFVAPKTRSKIKNIVCLNYRLG